MQEIKKGIYQHYKGGKYKVLSIANHSETLEKFVVYQMLYDNNDYKKGTFWIRPLEMFLENIIVNGTEMQRFKFIK